MALVSRPADHEHAYSLRIWLDFHLQVCAGLEWFAHVESDGYWLSQADHPAEKFSARMEVIQLIRATISNAPNRGARQVT